MRNNTTRQFIKLSRQRMDGWGGLWYRHYGTRGHVRAGVVKVNTRSTRSL